VTGCHYRKISAGCQDRNWDRLNIRFQPHKNTHRDWISLVDSEAHNGAKWQKKKESSILRDAESSLNRHEAGSSTSLVPDTSDDGQVL
jgi:hypothetical protein